METSDQNAVDGFSFSQDLTSGLSQMYSQMTTQSMDSGFYGDSQSFGGLGAVPAPKRPFFDQMVPPSFPPSFPEVKKTKYNLPKWTKGKDLYQVLKKLCNVLGCSSIWTCRISNNYLLVISSGRHS